MDKPEYFLQFEPGLITQLRELYLQLQSLNRIQSPVINRARQQLAREFPEAALKNSPQARDGLSPLWAWLAHWQREQVRNNHYYDRLYQGSLAPKYGVEITDFTRNLARLLCQIHLWERDIEREIAQLLNYPQFQPYTKAFNSLGIDIRCQALILSQMYPLTRFSSLGAFKRRLGMGRDENSSGDKLSSRAGGSQMCRSQLYLWVLDKISIKSQRPPTPVGQRLSAYYDLKAAQFSEDPDLVKEKVLVREKRRLKLNFQESLHSSFGELLTKDQFQVISQRLDTKFFEDVLEINQTQKMVKQGVVRKGFGVLVINQVVAYGCKLLFQEIKRNLLELD